MSEDTNNQTANSNAPTHVVCVATKSGGKTYWTRIGAGWEHTSGGGINFRNVANPIDGCFTIFQATEKPE